jgi:mannose-6-phosphate isomerase-like protein (cupin superfamily)
MLVAKTTPMLNRVKPYGPTTNIGEGDHVELADIEYEHPFGLGKEKPGGTEKGGGVFDEWRAQRAAALADELKNGRVIRKAEDIHWEYSAAHKGELNAMLAYPGLGFGSRMPFHIGLQAIAPGGSNETHIHMEAIVYILSGKGTVVVNGASSEIGAGDCCFVHWGDLHQFRASKDSSELFVQMRIHLKELLDWLFPFPWFEEKKDVSATEPEANYVPKLPW